MNTREEQRRRAAQEAVKQVQTGMIIGLGTGSTVLWALERLAECLESGVIKEVYGVPSSSDTAEKSVRLGIPLTELDSHPELDLTIDGADEIDPCLNLIKGGGGALLREKVLAQASRRNVIVVDESKLSPYLGCRHTLPIEVTAFAVRSIEGYLLSLGAKVHKRRSRTGNLFLTDQKNLILDIDVGPILDPASLAAKLEGRAGIVAHGLFLNLADEVIVGKDNRVQHLRQSV
jgi:ribose 5-phosphate isomerase A